MYGFAGKNARLHCYRSRGPRLASLIFKEFNFVFTFIMRLNVVNESMFVPVVHVTAGQVRSGHVQLAQTAGFHYLAFVVQQVQSGVVHGDA